MRKKQKVSLATSLHETHDAVAYPSVGVPGARRGGVPPDLHVRPIVDVHHSMSCELGVHFHAMQSGTDGGE